MRQNLDKIFEPLSVRAKNSLMAAEVYNIDQLLKYNVRELRKFRNAGYNTVNEIVLFVKCLGYELGQKRIIENTSDKNPTVFLIKQWVRDRNLHTQDPKVQMCKVMEELGELAKAINKNDIHQQIDGIGDVVVTLICVAEQLGLNFEECIKTAYNEIKDRKGKLVNGTFVKESDL